MYFYVFISSSGANPALCEIQFRKKTLATVRGSKDNRKSKHAPAGRVNNNNIISIYVAYIETGQRHAKVHGFQFLICLELNYFMSKVNGHSRYNYIQRSGQNIQLHLFTFHVLESCVEFLNNIRTFMCIVGCRGRLLLLRYSQI